MWHKLGTRDAAAWRRSDGLVSSSGFSRSALRRRAADPLTRRPVADADTATEVDPAGSPRPFGPRPFVAGLDVDQAEEIQFLRRRLKAMARDLESSESDVATLRLQLESLPIEGLATTWSDSPLAGGAVDAQHDRKKISLLTKIVEENLALRESSDPS